MGWVGGGSGNSHVIKDEGLGSQSIHHWRLHVVTSVATELWSHVIDRNHDDIPFGCRVRLHPDDGQRRLRHAVTGSELPIMHLALSTQQTTDKFRKVHDCGYH